MAATELGRRLVHVAGGFPVYGHLIGWLAWPQVRTIYLLGIGAALVLEAVRLLVGVDWWIYRELTREYEQENPAGYALYVIGAAAVALAFEPRVAVPAVLMLAIVDPVSGLLTGSGRRRFKHPRVLAVTFALAGAIALAFVPLPAAVAGAAIATAADGATPVVRGYVVDDNLGIPIGAGVAMWVVVQLPV